MKKKSKTVKLTCIDCGKSDNFSYSSPAAPTLTACETAEKSGWSYQIGFFTMLTGDHQTRCPDCTKKINNHKESHP